MSTCGAGDDLVTTVIAAIPPSALSSGVVPLSNNVRRFPELKKAIRRVALVPDHSGLFEHALSWLAAAVTFEKHGLV